MQAVAGLRTTVRSKLPAFRQVRSASGITEQSFGFHAPVAAIAGPVELDGSKLTIEELSAIGAGSLITVSDETLARLAASRAVVEKIVASGKPSYGSNTGFGLLSNVAVTDDKLEELQYNIVRSHATGVGDALPLAQCRRILALRINTLAKGFSGVSLSTFQALVTLINANAIPLVPCQGTVGASGDLAPLAHLALGLIGEGKCWHPREHAYRPTPHVLADLGIAPAQLKAKDGLSLVNGTQFIVGVGSVAAEVATNCLRAAQPVAALTLASMHGHPIAFDERVHAVRNHEGQQAVAELMRRLVPLGSISTTTDDVQDPYSLRCIPQVHGVVMENVRAVRDVLQREMNSATDNPLVFGEVDGKEAVVISQGNFHGEFPAKALDTLTIHIGELGRISLARIMMLVDPHRNRGMPAFLARRNAGLNSALMTWELTAAALDAENRTLSTPASVETVPTSAGKEDHVSMGGFAARKALKVAENVQRILAIELLAATHALHIRHDQAASRGTRMLLPSRLRTLYAQATAASPPADGDRFWGADFEAMERLLAAIAKNSALVTGQPQSGSSPQVPAISARKQPEPQLEPQELDSTVVKSASTWRPHPFVISPTPQALAGLVRSREFNSALGSSPSALALSPSESGLETALLEQGGGIALLDMSESDYGSVANFGRGHGASERGGPLGGAGAYTAFLTRLANAQLNSASRLALSALRLVGSLDTDGTGLPHSASTADARIPTQRTAVLSAVAETHRRAEAVFSKVLGSADAIFLVNGDHDHMAPLIRSVAAHCREKGTPAPVVAYLDLHADARPVSDGPHSGTWCAEALAEDTVSHVYAVGLNPLANNDATIGAMDDDRVTWAPYNWLNLARGSATIPSAIKDIVAHRNLHHADAPMIVSVCGDSVRGLPASAASYTAGFDPAAAHMFVHALAASGPTIAGTVAEVKTSLATTAGERVAAAEFLTQAAYVFADAIVGDKHQK